MLFLRNQIVKLLNTIHLYRQIFFLNIDRLSFFKLFFNLYLIFCNNQMKCVVELHARVSTFIKQIN